MINLYVIDNKRLSRSNQNLVNYLSCQMYVCLKASALASGPMTLAIAQSLEGPGLAMALRFGVRFSKVPKSDLSLRFS